MMYSICTLYIYIYIYIHILSLSLSLSLSQIFMGNYSSLVGAATFIIIFFGSNIVKHLGWRCVCSL